MKWIISQDQIKQPGLRLKKKVGIRILLKVVNEYRPKGSTLDLDLDRP